MIGIETYVKGASTNVAEFYRFDSERRTALLTMDESTIKKFYRSWGIEFPRRGESFWEAVAKNILSLPDIPPYKRIEAACILDELNVGYNE